MILKNEILTILWLKFSSHPKKKVFTSNIQIEVLIAIFVLSVSVAASALGVNSYRKQYLQLSTKRHLYQCVEEIAEHIEFIYPQWKTNQSFSTINTSPLSFLSLESYTTPTSLEEIVSTCSMDLPSFLAKRDVSFVCGKKENYFGEVRSEHIFFYCYTYIFDHLIFASVMKTYVVKEG